MIKKLFIVTALMMLALSACGGGGAAETVTPTLTNTLPPTVAPATTVAPPATETPTSGTPVTATPTVGTVAPTNPPGCTNSATFVADITIPDNTNIAAGATFTKTWRIANSGTCVWGPDYKLTYYSADNMGAIDVPLDITYPGQNLDISMTLTAPNSAGSHQANFVIKNSTGAILKVGDDSRLWVVINVSVGGTATSTVAVTTTPGGATATKAAAATAPAATLAVATVGSSTGETTACLPNIDRTKLMETINAVNAYRTEKGLPAYTVNPKLAQAAQRHATDMACKKVVAHNGSDNSTPQSRVADTGYKAASVSENVYSSNPPFTGDGVVNWWATDKTEVTNNNNLLSTTFTQIGVGYAILNRSGYYVIVFAKP